MNKFLLGEVRFLFAQCVFNTYCQYAAFGRYSKKRDCKHIYAICISSFTIIVLILNIIGFDIMCQPLLRVSAVLGLASTGCSLIFELFNKEDLSELMFQHKQAAEEYKNLRDSLMDMIRQIKEEGDKNIVETRLQQSLHDYSMLGKYSLSTTKDDFECAQKSLGLNGEGEAFTWSSEEIDRFLPYELKENIL